MNFFGPKGTDGFGAPKGKGKTAGDKFAAGAQAPPPAFAGRKPEFQLQGFDVGNERMRLGGVDAGDNPYSARGLGTLTTNFDESMAGIERLKKYMQYFVPAERAVALLLHCSEAALYMRPQDAFPQDA